MANEELSLEYWLKDRPYKFIKFIAYNVLPTLIAVNSLILATVSYPGAGYVTLALAALLLLLERLMVYSKDTAKSVPVSSEFKQEGTD
jgi:hypothetical protein